MVDRFGRRDDRRPAREDNRNHATRYEQDRSRSPHRRDRRDDRRRERSPPRGPSGRGGPPSHSRGDRDREYTRSRDTDGAPGKSRSGYANRQPRDFSESKINGAGIKKEADIKQEEIKMEVDEDEEPEAAMRRIMGFSDFKSTKNTKVPGNDRNYAVHRVKKAEYRQYMNRVGGFNRPLDAI